MFINKCIHSEELECGDLFLSDIFLETVGGRSVCILSKTRKSAREGKKKKERKKERGVQSGVGSLENDFAPLYMALCEKKEERS